jgi:hypothetical protein
MTTYANPYAERVARGVERLEEHFVDHNWRRDINPDTMCIDDFYLCVLAQLFGNYTEGLYELGIKTRSEEIEYGFEVDGGDDPDELTQAWLDVL